jgi:arylamine N-acetyltransferase
MADASIRALSERELLPSPSEEPGRCALETSSHLLKREREENKIMVEVSRGGCTHPSLPPRTSSHTTETQKQSEAKTHTLEKKQKSRGTCASSSQHTWSAPRQAVPPNSIQCVLSGRVVTKEERGGGTDSVAVGRAEEAVRSTQSGTRGRGRIIIIIKEQPNHLSRTL